MDVNDNAPEFAMFYETFVCENAKAEQVCCLLVLRKYSKLNEFCYYSCITSSSRILCTATNLIAKLNSGCTVSDFTQYSSSWRDGMFLNVLFCTAPCCLWLFSFFHPLLYSGTFTVSFKNNLMSVNVTGPFCDTTISC